MVLISSQINKIVCVIDCNKNTQPMLTSLMM